MSDPPFAVSPEAAAYIEDAFRSGDAHPPCAGFLPCLYHRLAQETRDRFGRILWRFRGESWGVGYQEPGVVTAHGYAPVELCGRTVWLEPAHLRILTGKRLVIETVEVGVPRPADKKVKMLRAV